VKLIDLGIARPPGPGRRGVGTPGYLAPEQARGSTVGPEADVYALGLVLHECLSGRRAFDGEFWSWLADHPRERALFDLAMEEGAERRVARLDRVPWRGDETVVDVGGGNGSLLRELIARRPGLHGIVYDLPETVRDEAALADLGIAFESGSFFDRVPVADVYVLGTVLHNWPDEDASSILRTIRSNAPAGAPVLILDLVVDPESAPPGVLWFDLLGHALFGAHERTEPEWRSLIGGAGLNVDAVHDGLIEARCP
jgi:serine/threonine protein kinase